MPFKLSNVLLRLSKFKGSKSLGSFRFKLPKKNLFFASILNISSNSSLFTSFANDELIETS